MIAITAAINHSSVITGITLPIRMHTRRLLLYVGNSIAFSLRRIVVEYKAACSLVENLNFADSYFGHSLTKVAVFKRGHKHHSTSSSDQTSILWIAIAGVQYTTVLSLSSPTVCSEWTSLIVSPYFCMDCSLLISFLFTIKCFRFNNGATTTAADLT